MGNLIKEKNDEKYLGDHINSDGLAASVTSTINARYWRLLSAVLEIRTIIEDYRIDTVGGILTGLELWNLAVVPVMLTNSGTWIEITEESTTKLNDLQNDLFKYLLCTPRSSPSTALCWDFGALPIKYRIMKEKLTLLYHIISLQENTLTKEIYESQKKFKFPGLIQECLLLIRNLNIPNITIEEVKNKISKIKWKQIVKNALKKKCEMELKEEIMTYKKIKRGTNEK